MKLVKATLADITASVVYAMERDDVQEVIRLMSRLAESGMPLDDPLFDDYRAFMARHGLQGRRH